MSERSPYESLPAPSDVSLLLVRRPDLLVAINQFCVWPEGFKFTLAVRLRGDSDAMPSINFSQFETLHESDIPFILRVSADDGDSWLVGPSLPQADGGGLYMTLGSGSLSPANIGRWDIEWWLNPMPEGKIIFEVSCPALGLKEVSTSTDASALASAGVGTVGFLDSAE